MDRAQALIWPMKPARSEAAEYYFKYIDQVPEGDILRILDHQRAEALAQLTPVTEERSLHRYAPGKWSVREVLAHLNDCERLFTFRAFWFARGFDSPLPSFDEKIAAAGARADRMSWQHHLEEFQAIRQATVGFFTALPREAWDRSGTASGNPFTVRALAYLAAGHLIHHLKVLEERYG